MSLLCTAPGAAQEMLASNRLHPHLRLFSVVFFNTGMSTACFAWVQRHIHCWHYQGLFLIGINWLGFFSYDISQVVVDPMGCKIPLQSYYLGRFGWQKCLGSGSSPVVLITCNFSVSSSCTAVHLCAHLGLHCKICLPRCGMNTIKMHTIKMHTIEMHN